MIAFHSTDEKINTIICICLKYLKNCSCSLNFHEHVFNRVLLFVYHTCFLVWLAVEKLKAEVKRKLSLSNQDTHL